MLTLNCTVNFKSDSYAKMRQTVFSKGLTHLLYLPMRHVLIPYSSPPTLFISAGLFAHDKNTSTMHLLFAIEPFMLCTNSASTVANKIFIKFFEIWLSFGPFHCLPIEGVFQRHFREALHCTLKTS